MVVSIGQAVAADETTYTDPSGRFSFTVPDGYEPRNPGTLGLGLLTETSPPAYFSPTFADAAVGIRVNSDYAPKSSSLLLAVNALNDAVQQPGTISKDPSLIQATVLGDLPAVRIEYDYVVTGIRMRLQQVTVGNGHNFYTITFSARASDFDAFLEETKVVLNSFSFLGNDITGNGSQRLGNG